MSSQPLRPPDTREAPSSGADYAALGGVVHSDFPFQDLERAEPECAADINFSATSRAQLPPLGELVRELHDADGGTQLRAYEDDAGVSWVIRDVGQIWAAASGAEVRYALLPDAEPREVEHFFVGPVLAVAAQMRGELVLHAGAVLDEGYVVAFTGPPGFGKSTLAASFGRAGATLFSDDTLPVRFAADGHVEAIPYMPKMKLWDESIEALSDRPGAGYERVLGRYAKRRIRPGSHWGRLANGPAPLRAIYFLDPSGARGSQIEVGAMDPLAATLQLQSAMYQAELLRGRRAQLALEGGARLVECVAIRAISYPRGFEQLPALREALRADARGLR